MAQNVQESKYEPIESIDEVEGQEKKKFWLGIPLALAIVVFLFLVVRYFASKQEEF
jgi:hypothetical protein